MFHIRLIKSKRDEMIKNRYKKQRRKYVPIRTCHSKKKNKKHEFISKGQETTINKEGIKMESSAVLQKNYSLWIWARHHDVVILLWN